METITLSNGVEMPMVGYGLLQMKERTICEPCLLEAFDAGYRLLDTASAYFNEEMIGEIIKKSQVPREELFVTSKLWIQDFGYEDAVKAFETTLKNLRLEYLDLYLIHHPFGNYYEAWRALEKLYAEGKIRAIGVSNFDGARLADLCLNSDISPMVDQIELHPFHQQSEMLHTMKSYGVKPQAWGPFCEGQRMIFDYKILNKIGRKYGKSAAQVVLRWNIQRGVAVIPGSSDLAHIRENIDIWDFSLSQSDMEYIEELDIGHSEIIDHHSAITSKWLNEWKIH